MYGRSHSIFSPLLFSLPSYQLPIKRGVARYILAPKYSKFSKNNEILQLAVRNIVKLWNLASIPTLSKKSIENKMNRLMQFGIKFSQCKKSKATKFFLFKRKADF